ncbi:MAG TPA: GNAT family protein [Polyangiaceae bacterium]|jgi:RimJ/RimL family protein N-acetyltransferase|nr:GNAT family protein [Polyangiaceae bacterium]
MKLEPLVLESAREGALVRLEPLADHHFDAVLAFARESPEIWTYIPNRVRERADVERQFGVARDFHRAGTGIVFATCAGPERRIVGSTSIRLVDPNTPSVEIGGTWIAPAWQRTRVNTEAKLLQLTHCFESLGVVRVELKTDQRNARSRAAIRRIGATEEGTFRRHMRLPDGTFRDSVYFSIIVDEWPAVKARLEDMTRS